MALLYGRFIRIKNFNLLESVQCVYRRAVHGSKLDSTLHCFDEMIGTGQGPVLLYHRSHSYDIQSKLRKAF